MTDKIQILLSRLKGVKRRRIDADGNKKWLALCPTHDDRTPSLSIKQLPDGKILIHCFCGCSVNQIVSAVDLTIADLMPEQTIIRRKNDRRRLPRFKRSDLFDKLVFESTVLYIAMAALLKKGELSETDLNRVNRAMNTIDELASEVKL